MPLDGDILKKARAWLADYRPENVGDGDFDESAQSLANLLISTYRQGMEAAALIAETQYADRGYHPYYRNAVSGVAAAIRSSTPSSSTGET